MTDRPTQQRRIVLASRPDGAPTAAQFRLETGPLPVPGPGQLLLRNEWVSVDAALRARLGAPGAHGEPLALGATVGAATVARVEAGQGGPAEVGDYVVAGGGWQDYAVVDARAVRRLWAGLPRRSLALGVLGSPGYTAYHGIGRIGDPKAGETVVVGAAAGPVGSIAGQLARLRGCRVVGIARGAAAAAHVTADLGFDACVDPQAADFGEALDEACPRGIDVYFETLGGRVFSAVLGRLNAGARVPVCGLGALLGGAAAGAGDSAPAGTFEPMGLLLRQVLAKRLRLEGFHIADHYGPAFGHFVRKMSGWLTRGEVTFHEEIVEGLEALPAAFADVVGGAFLGKVVVRVDG